MDSPLDLVSNGDNGFYSESCRKNDGFHIACLELNHSFELCYYFNAPFLHQKPTFEITSSTA